MERDGEIERERVLTGLAGSGGSREGIAGSR